MAESGLLTKFKKDPADLVKRAINKIIIGPVRYGKGDDYDAGKYWQDRLSKHGSSLKGVGNEGLSEEDNKKTYREAAKKFTLLLKKENINVKNMSVLDIGCGSGFYTKLLADLGVKNYVGIDITDFFFPKLKKEFPNYMFERKDATSSKIAGSFNLIIMMDVIEHIVNDNKFKSAMKNIKDSLSRNGAFIVAPIWNDSKKHLFYVRSWSLKEIKKEFLGYTFRRPVPFTQGNMLVIWKK